MEDYTDVCIVGAGPAGLMASLSLSAAGVSHQIIDKLGTRALNGRADGFHPRTYEIWDSFNIADRLDSHGCAFGEVAIWTPHPEASDGIMCQHKEPANGKDLRTMRGLTIHQGHIEAALIEGIKARNGPVVQRGIKPCTLSIDDASCKDHSSYPITLEVEHLTGKHLEVWGGHPHSITSTGQVREEPGWIEAFGRDPEDTVPHVSGGEGYKRTIHAKYLIGADGAHSWIRRQMPDHFVMEGANRNSVFGVIDILPITDFPDIRRLCTIFSAHGTILLIPRENGLVRLYVQMPDEDEEENFKQVASLQSAQKTLKIAQRILHPYSIEYKYCDWCTVYTVGQRVSNHFSYKDRLFLAGDAIHTHTPKGGQGANVSQQDTYNLGWKLAGVLSGQLAPSILSTYEEERRPVAQELIELDLALADIFTGKSLASKEGVKSVYERNRKHGNGDICYTSNVLIAAPDECDASRATGLRLGQRIPNADIVNQASGCLSSVHARLKSNGQWRVLVFPGSLADESRLQQTNATGEELASILARLPSAKSNGVASKANTLEVTLIHAGTPDSVEASALHSIYFPSDERSGYDYNTVFAAAPPMAGAKMRSVYDLFGIAEDAGALVVVRPDQVVAWIGGAADLDSMRSWLYRFMVLGGET